MVFSKTVIYIYITFAKENKFNWDLQFWHKTNACPNHFNHLIVDTEYCIRIYTSGSYFNNELTYRDYNKYFLENVQSIDGHPTPKPLRIIKSQLNVFSKKNDIILDCFLGSGTTAVACKQLGRKCLGIEISEEYCKIARQRLAQEVLF